MPDLENAKPIQLAERHERTNTIAPYYLEEVRQQLEREYGAERLYQDGLVVRSTLDSNLQRAANRAVSKGLRTLDKRHGFRGVKDPSLVTGTTGTLIQTRVCDHSIDISE